MRIAIVHSYYRNTYPSGENISVDRLANILESRGHVVKVLGRQSANKQNLAEKLDVGFKFVTNNAWNPDFELEQFSPDVIHVHNMFPNLSTKWINKWGSKTVLTLHNFRFACANGLLLRDGKFCDRCVTVSPISSLRFSCYKESAIETLPWYLRQVIDPRNFKLLTGVNRIICLNNAVKDLVLKWVNPKLVIDVIPNIVDDSIHIIPNFAKSRVSDSYVFAGNLSPEKGILELAKSWNDTLPKLHIFGDGPLRPLLPIQKNILIHGKVDNAKVQFQIRNSSAVIIPSLCLENLPTIYLESLLNGVPVIANEACIVGRLVDEQGTGKAFKTFEQIPHLMKLIKARQKEFSHTTLQSYNLNYRPSTVIESIESVYAEIVKKSRSTNK